MRTLNRLLVTACDIVVFMSVTGLIFSPSIYSKNNPPDIEEDGDGPGRSKDRRADPCNHLPDPPGNAKGHDKKCPPLGSSSGIAKGDFNGDSFGDLAIGVPHEDLGSIADAGLVTVIYGSVNRLVANGGGVPANQFWHQDSPNVLEQSESNDDFGSVLAAGDFDDNGCADLAIGVPREDFDDALPTVANSGAVNVIYGQPGGLNAGSLPVSQFWHQNTSGIVDDAETEDRFGSTLTAWDFNGDSVSDLAIGVPREDVVTGGVNITDAGQVHILRGRRTILTSIAPQIGGLTSALSTFFHQDSPGVSNSVESGDQFGKALY